MTGTCVSYSGSHFDSRIQNIQIHSTSKITILVPIGYLGLRTDTSVDNDTNFYSTNVMRCAHLKDTDSPCIQYIRNNKETFGQFLYL